jgi:putative sterol carrier protein
MRYTVAELFSTMHERFKPEAASDLEAAVVYEFGDGRAWTVRISKGALKVDAGDSAHGRENVRVIFKNENIMLGIIANKVDPVDAILGGDLRVAGNWKLLIKVRSAFEIPAELLGGDTGSS